mmetsp:Transcript_90533/g.251701  ORF Transcript_90533/g.251701 Transcript_90533/m.251701 type:complete len:382 (+) Transcript_90533:421-1566(+)
MTPLARRSGRGSRALPARTRPRPSRWARTAPCTSPGGPRAAWRGPSRGSPTTGWPGTPSRALRSGWSRAAATGMTGPWAPSAWTARGTSTWAARGAARRSTGWQSTGQMVPSPGCRLAAAPTGTTGRRWPRTRRAAPSSPALWQMTMPCLARPAPAAPTTSSSSTARTARWLGWTRGPAPRVTTRPPWPWAPAARCMWPATPVGRSPGTATPAVWTSGWEPTARAGSGSGCPSSAPRSPRCSPPWASAPTAPSTWAARPRAPSPPSTPRAATITSWPNAARTAQPSGCARAAAPLTTRSTVWWWTAMATCTWSERPVAPSQGTPRRVAGMVSCSRTREGATLHALVPVLCPLWKVHGRVGSRDCQPAGGCSAAAPTGTRAC